MAHELSIRANGMAEMAYAGSVPWHGLGQVVTKGADIDTWLKQAGMDWEAKTSPVNFTVDQGDVSMETQAPGYKAIYRGDSGSLLSIVGEGYNVVQPRELLEFFRDEVAAGGWYIHTAGVLRGGRKLWAMATTDDAEKYVKSYRKMNAGNADRVALNLLLGTSLDGSMRTTARLTTVRVVCANTLALALGERGDHVQISHRSEFNSRVIKQALGVAADRFALFMKQAEQMSEEFIDVEEARSILATIFKASPSVVAKTKVDTSWLGSLASGSQEAEEGDDEEPITRSVGRVLALFDGEGMGSALPTAKGTRWGLLNAVTQYVDHEMGRTQDTRLDNAWYGRGQDYKRQALKMLAEVA